MNRPDEPARMVQDFDNGTLSRIHTPSRRIGPWSRSSVWLALVGVLLFATLAAWTVADAPQPECQMEDC